MRRTRPRLHGYTLVELTAVLALVALGLSVLAPSARHQLDRATALEAREALAGLLIRTRVLAIRHGGARLVIDADARRASTMVGDSIFGSLVLPEGVVVRVGSGARRSTEVAFNGLGIGVFANETVELVRGEASVRLVISSYGRVRRE